MTTPDLEKDVFIICSCEKRCRKDQHPLSTKLYAEGARCSVWISRTHLRVVAATVLRQLKAENVK